MLDHPVTNGEYRRFDPKHEKTHEDLPVVNVSWYQAYAYAAWLGGRLPTEAEWEYACRAESLHEYSHRDGSKAKLEEVGWFKDNSRSRIQPIKKLEPNPWRLYDMLGNVWEWTADWYASYRPERQIAPWGPPRGEQRTLRGGCWFYFAESVRAACRHHYMPDYRYSYVGFRVVRSSTRSV